MKGKIFTLEGANQLIPLLSRIIDDVVARYADLVKEEKNLSAVQKEQDSRKGEDRFDGQAVEECGRRLDELLIQFAELINEAERLGCSVEDYERGCVDCYGEVDGEIVYYCWKRGEPEFLYWHGVDQGFGKRQCIPAMSRKRG